MFKTQSGYESQLLTQANNKRWMEKRPLCTYFCPYVLLYLHPVARMMGKAPVFCLCYRKQATKTPQSFSDSHYMAADFNTTVLHLFAYSIILGKLLFYCVLRPAFYPIPPPGVFKVPYQLKTCFGPITTLCLSFSIIQGLQTHHPQVLSLFVLPVNVCSHLSPTTLKLH